MIFARYRLPLPHSSGGRRAPGERTANGPTRQGAARTRTVAPARNAPPVRARGDRPNFDERLARSALYGARTGTVQPAAVNAPSRKDAPDAA